MVMKGDELSDSVFVVVRSIGVLLFDLERVRYNHPAFL